MPKTCTPLRYPGGKTKLYPLIRKIMEKNSLIGKPYAEPFAGGAGVAMKLLLRNEVPEIVVNDADRAVFCIWDAIVHNADNLCDFVASVPLEMSTWLELRDVYRNGDQASDFDLACSAFYLNRTNVSGILGGGVIGGQKQAGRYKLDARFNRKTLQREIRAIGHLADRITLTNLDVEDFIDEHLQDSDAFAYLDPPYVEKGATLYRSAFDEQKHRALARAVQRCKSRWAMSYDANPLIHDLYSRYRSIDLDIIYTANRKATSKEKLILGPGLVSD